MHGTSNSNYRKTEARVMSTIKKNWQLDVSYIEDPNSGGQCPVDSCGMVTVPGSGAMKERTPKQNSASISVICSKSCRSCWLIASVKCNAFSKQVGLQVGCSVALPQLWLLCCLPL